MEEWSGQVIKPGDYLWRPWATTFNNFILTFPVSSDVSDIDLGMSCTPN